MSGFIYYWLVLWVFLFCTTIWVFLLKADNMISLLGFENFAHGIFNN